MKKDMQTLYYTVDEAALILRVDPKTIKRWLRKGLLKGRKFGDRLWRIPVGEVVAKQEK
jgi:excisionase family DNA binding protein